MKNIKKIFLSVLLILGVVGCSNNKNDNLFTFQEVFGRKIDEIKDVKYIALDLNYPHEYKGNYIKFIDLKYEFLNNDNFEVSNFIDENRDLLFLISFKTNKEDLKNPVKMYLCKEHLYVYGYTNEVFRTIKKISLDDILDSHNENDIPQIPEGEEKIANFNAKFDYGGVVEEQAFLLLDSMKIFFELEKYNIKKIIAGDTIRMKYKGLLTCLTVYPEILVTDEIYIISIEQIKATIIELEISQDDEGNKTLISSDETYKDNLIFNTNYVVNYDLSYVEFNNLEIGAKLYGTISPTSENNIISALYSYNPRTED